MANEEQLALLKQGVEPWNNWRNNNPESMIDLHGTNLSYANLSPIQAHSINLEGADLNNAIMIGMECRHGNLRTANLSGANLRGANLRWANLTGANLKEADLSGADLSGATLSGADLTDANLSDADLRNASLRNASLFSANFNGTNLTNANLFSANLADPTNLQKAKSDYTTVGLGLACPEEGSFVAWKKADSRVIKLKVTETAKRSSATGTKCRVSEAIVLGLYSVEKEELPFPREGITSDYDSSFVYHMGEKVAVSNFDENRWEECAPGIHCFLNFSHAAAY